jgi:hypothetical protein
MKEKNDIWYWYHNISECYYHIQLTVKYRKGLLDKRVKDIILEAIVGFKERYAIEIQQIGFDQRSCSYLMSIFTKIFRGTSSKDDKKYNWAAYI